MILKKLFKQKSISAQRAVGVSFSVNFADILMNGITFLFTGSVVMLAQALEGIADLVASGMVLIGLKRSKRVANADYPFGYGREIYFWTLLSSLVMFTVLAGFTIYSGWERLVHQEPIERIYLAVLVLIFTLITNGYALSVDSRRIFTGLPKKIKTFFDSTMIETKTALIMDLMGFLSALTGLVAIALYWITGNLFFDGLGAIIIGFLMLFFSGYMIKRSRDFLIGKSVPVEIREKIIKAALDFKEVQEVLDLRATVIGSDFVFVNIEVHLVDNLITQEIEKIIDRIKVKIKEAVPTANHIQVELETPDSELNI